MDGLYMLNPISHEYYKPESLDEWSRFMKNPTLRQVKKTEVGNILVSTVFLGVDQAVGHGQPILFETCVLGGKLDGEITRYRTYEKALIGHEKMVDLVKAVEGNLFVRR